jgi:hypothetical protein
MTTAIVNEYDIGDSVRVSVSTATDEGVPTDPTALTVNYKVANGTVVSKVYGVDSEVMKAASGEFYIDIDVTSDMNGALVKYRWVATGAVKGADEGAFRVRQSGFY